MCIKTVRVAGHDYTIVWHNDEYQNLTECHGQCDTAKLEIHIHKGPRQQETLLHEIGHAIWYEYGCEDVKGEEAINSRYMTGLHQVLRDNKRLVENKNYDTR